MLGNIAKHSGRKMGLVRHEWFLWRYRFGLLRGFHPVDLQRVDRLVFVCQGNICRSPYAEARARAEGLCATSFGLSIGQPGPANETMVQLATLAQLDLSNHRSRSLSDLAITPHDLLLGLEPCHGWALAPLVASTAAQVSLLGLWAAQPRPHIEDPFGLSHDYFRTCMSVIDDAIVHLARVLRSSRSPVSGDRS